MYVVVADDGGDGDDDGDDGDDERGWEVKMTPCLLRMLRLIIISWDRLIKFEHRSESFSLPYSGEFR
jgi:hypothetical protein